MIVSISKKFLNSILNPTESFLDFKKMKIFELKYFDATKGSPMDNKLPFSKL